MTTITTASAKELMQKMYRFIVASDVPVSMDTLIEKSTRYDKHTALEALSLLHRVKEIKKTTRDDGVFYSKEVVKIKSIDTEPRVQETEEERHIRIEECRVFWEQSPLVSDEERACYYNNWQGERCQELCSTPAEIRYQEQKKYGARAKPMRERKALEEILNTKSI